MNSLGYALLSMLVRKSCTGYELKQLLEVFWNAKHSQIYPLLSKLEEDEFVTYVHVEQTGKPDKKIYSITDKGRSLLQKWISNPPAPPVARDEFLIKAYAISLADVETGISLFQERLALYEEKLAKRKVEIGLMEKEYGEKLEDIKSNVFGRYILFKRKLLQEQEEINWCKWVLSYLEKEVKTNRIMS
ncbi:PadR family transcriptional regulator [Fictibacillus gelatini]|uniref:PadR family transcriptional regulator n=1 Tax=Fictibacillus gelatini TaxID=225985 RepID=UPI000421FFF6|nr:PadR family transcriptional regulator [Fictibacillus gelatini]